MIKKMLYTPVHAFGFGYEAHVMRDGVGRHMLHNAIFNELFPMTCLF